MEILFKIIDILAITVIFSFPILLIIFMRKMTEKRIFLKYIIICLPIFLFLIIVGVWWSDVSNHLLMTHYGYNFGGMGYDEIYGGVASENSEKVKLLERSIMGIGWPLRAFFVMVMLFPYPFVVYFVSFIVGKIKKIK